MESFIVTKNLFKDVKDLAMILTKKEYNEKMNEKKPDAFNYTLKELIRLEKRTSGIVVMIHRATN